MAFDYQWDFEDGLTTNFARVGDGTVPTNVNGEQAHSGTRAVKCVTTTADFVAALEFRFGNAASPWLTSGIPQNPGIQPGGFWIDYWMWVSEADAAHVSENQVDPRQWKLCLARQDIDLGGGTGAWFQHGFGEEEGSSPTFRTIRNLCDSGAISTNDYMFSAGPSGNTAFEVPGSTWWRTTYHYQRDTNQSKGRAKCWINSNLVTDTGWVIGFGTNDSAKEQSIRIGICTVEAHGQTITCYLDDIRITDTAIFPDIGGGRRRFSGPGGRHRR